MRVQVVSYLAAALATLLLAPFVPWGLIWLVPVFPLAAVILAEDLWSIHQFRRAVRELTDA